MRLSILSLAFLGLAGSLFGADWPDPASLPARPGTPSPLVMFDGTPVATKEAWETKRRPELKELFQYYMYGPIPPSPRFVGSRTEGVYRDFLGGKAVLKLVAIGFGDPNGLEIPLMVITPAHPKDGPSPVFLAMNFCGNHALVDDPRIPLTRGWLYSSCAGCVTNHATPAARGGQAKDWPLEQIIDRGYGLASFCTSDVDSDQADVSDGLYAWLAKKAGTNNPPAADRGTIAAWAWGFERCVDYLVTDHDIDSKRIAAVGHSRNGKTALLAAAFDDRIALCIPHQAGCGGTAPSRSTVGESVKRINTAFPHWFNARFKQFNDNPSLLPFDQNCLIALVAPRPILLGNASEDQWANPAGQFEMLKAAAPVYELLGAGRMQSTEMPENGKLLTGKLGYLIREGKHSMTAADWGKFLDYADAQWKSPSK